MKALVVAGALCAAVSAAQAHDVWADGSPIPPWVKSSCCGPDDVHHLRPDQVHETPDGKYFLVDGYKEPIPASLGQPSQDGDYWIFYRDYADGRQSQVYCFFMPMVGQGGGGYVPSYSVTWVRDDEVRAPAIPEPNTPTLFTIGAAAVGLFGWLRGWI